MLSSLLAPLVTAQEASTPVAITIPEPEQSQPAPPTEIAAPLPTSTELAETPAAEPTTEPTDTPVEAPNTDRVAPLTAPTVLQPGQTIELPLSYQITTARRETGIHVELRTAANVPADGWVIEANGTGGFSVIDVVDTQTDPGLLALTVHLTAPDDAVDGDTLTLTLSSVVHTIAGAFETGVPPETPVAAIVVDAPEPTPTKSTGEAPPASPESDDERPATPSPQATQTNRPEPVDATPLPASPMPDTPAPAEPPDTAIDLAAELTLVGRKPHDTVAIDASHAVTLDYRYTVGFARTGTAISAQVVNWNGEPAANWLVHINGATDPLYDTEHLDAGSAFDLEVTITAGEDVPANSKARLLFTVSVDPAANSDEPAASTFALASVETAADEAPETGLSQTFDGPMLRLDGGFSTSAVMPSGGDNGLKCDNANSYAGGDALIPGQIIEFICHLTVTGVSVIGELSGTASITSSNGSGWEIAGSGQIGLLGATLLSPTSGWKSPSVEFSSTSLASIGSGKLVFAVWVKAPTVPLPIVSNAVAVSVETTCYSTLGLLDCQGHTLLSGRYDATSAVTLTANVADIQTIENGGGAVTDLGLLGSLGAQISNGLIFSLTCTRPSGTTTQIQPHQVIDITCAIKSLIDLKILGTLSTVNAAVSLSFSNTTDVDWHYSIIDGSDKGQSTTLNIRSVLETGGLGAEYPFKVRLMYTPSGCVSTSYINEKLNALQVSAAYELALAVPVLGVASNITLTDGWANIPVQLAGASYESGAYTPRLSAADGISFGSYQFSRTSASYTRVGADTPTLTVGLSPTGGTNCSGQMWYVTAQFSPLAGYRDSSLASPLGTMISASQIAFSGTASNPNEAVTTMTPTITGLPATIIKSTASLFSELNISFPMALTPPPSQPVGYYLGTVTLTVVSGSPP